MGYVLGRLFNYCGRGATATVVSRLTLAFVAASAVSLEAAKQPPDNSSMRDGACPWAGPVAQRRDPCDWLFLVRGYLERLVGLFALGITLVLGHHARDGGHNIAVVQRNEAHSLGIAAGDAHLVD